MTDTDQDKQNDLLSALKQQGTFDDRLVGVELEGKYKILERLGGGGMGVVYRGRHTLIDRIVAIKVLRSNLVEDSEQERFFARFQQEARASSKIQHPHAVGIYDFGLHETYPYIVMQYINGRPLKKVLKEDGPLDLATVSRLLEQLGSALAEAHASGVIHRDLKPDNIMVEKKHDGSIHGYVVDFGIAKMCVGSGSELGLTKTGAIVGTPQYMSPEQVQSQPVDLRSDIYSLGIMLYEMVTGEVPFQADSAVSVLMMHVSEKPVPCRKFKPELKLPSGVEAAVMKAIEKDPSKRHASVQELVEQFCSAAARQTTTTQAVSAEFPTLAHAAAWIMPGKRRAGAALAAMIAALLLFAGLRMFELPPFEPRPAKEAVNKVSMDADAGGGVEIVQRPMWGEGEEMAVVSLGSEPEAGMPDAAQKADTGTGSAPIDPAVQRDFERAVELHTAKALPEAAAAYQAVLEREPGMVKALANLGDVYITLEENEKARMVLARAAELNPDSTGVLANLGFVYGRLGLWNEAVEVYKQSIERRPDYALAHNNLGHAYQQLNQPTEAEKAYLRAIELDPAYVRAYHNLGDLYVENNELQKAAQMHRKGAQSAEDNYQGWRRLGDVLARQGRQADAREAYRRSLAIRPDYAAAKRRLRALGR